MGQEEPAGIDDKNNAPQRDTPHSDKKEEHVAPEGISRSGRTDRVQVPEYPTPSRP
jgi:hypothetical protein